MSREGAEVPAEVRAATFSIVACDLTSREWGVAIASRFLAIGALSAWAEPEVGAIATQAWIRASHGADGLRLLAQGRSAQEAMDELLAEDGGRAQRQLGVVDGEGRTATHTGDGCLEWAGERTGRCYSAQGNLLASGQTVAALGDAFESHHELPLAERLMGALAAGDAAGGDRRGKQAAAIRVVGSGTGYGGADIVVDLRVDDHPEPVGELRRLFELHQLYFGSTPEDEWVDVDEQLEAELRDRLEKLGYGGGDLASALDAWAGTENLEERVRGVDRIDPVVLDQLRNQHDQEDAHG